jgi:4-alpha-glucanotransferase
VNPKSLRVPSLSERASGVLLHPTSLPGPYGCGGLGDCARRFVRFLAAAGQRFWQMLPVNPPGEGSSPYSARSAFAGSPLLIDLDVLAGEGLLSPDDLASKPDFPEDRVDFEATAAFREAMLGKAFAAFEERGPSEERHRFERFCEESRSWLDDYALYSALRRRGGGVPWWEWEPGLRDRAPDAMERARRELRGELDLLRFQQYLFDKQWRELRVICAGLGIGLIGDIPIFVAHDSADVWQHRDIFRLDDRGMPTVVAGVPPDYFSKTGQRWGNPLYRWARMKKGGYSWWVQRLATTLSRFDVVRLDHFIGFQRYYEIPASSPTAEKGRWMKGPSADFFRAVRDALGSLPLIAEDLGAVSPKVKALRDRFNLPGTRVLQFAFGEDVQATDFLPHNFVRRSVVYTGTHDNDTIVGWFNDPGGEGTPRSPEQAQAERAACLRYVGTEGSEIHWDMIRMALLSVADLAIFPVQDLLGLGSDARMNRPGTGSGNWAWRLREGALSDPVAERLLGLTRTYGRA